MIHNMKLQNDPFMMIDNGSKTIELRLYDEKRQKVKKGDLIKFTNIDTNQTILTKVINMHVFTDFKNLYKAFDKISLGYKKDEKANPLDMEKYYNPLDIEKYGVIGIEIEKVDNELLQNKKIVKKL